MQEPEKDYTSSNFHNIVDVYISIQLDRDQVILTLKNHGHNHEEVYIQYQKTKNSGTVLFKSITLSFGKTTHLKLPTGIMKWHKFECRLVGKKHNSSPILDLKRILKEAKTKSQKVEFRNHGSNNESDFASKVVTTKNTKSEKETDNTRLHFTTEFQPEEVNTNLDKQEHEIGFKEVRHESNLNDIVEIEPSKTLKEQLTIPNQIAQTIRKWITELEKSEYANQDVIQTLRYSEQEFKKLLNAKTECNPKNSEEYDQLIINRLFNGVVRFIQSERLPEQLKLCLELVGYEVVPIEIGKTQVDARVHDIQASRQTGSEYGTVVEVLIPGLRRITDGEIIQKPVVIRGE